MPVEHQLTILTLFGPYPPPPDALSVNDSGFATATSDGEATVQVSIVTALGTTIYAKTSFTISRAVTVITETTTMTNDSGTNTSTIDSDTAKSTLTDTSTITTTVSDTSTLTTDTDSTPTLDDDVVVTAPQSYQGTIHNIKL